MRTHTLTKELFKICSHKNTKGDNWSLPLVLSLLEAMQN